MRKKDRDYVMFVEDIIRSVDLIEKYIKGYTKKKFVSDEKVKDAIIRRFEIMGEAVKNLPVSFRNKHKEIEWKKITGMRDILIHEYFGVNADKVWKTIKDDIPALKIKLKEIQKEFKLKTII